VKITKRIKRNEQKEKRKENGKFLKMNGTIYIPVKIIMDFGNQKWVTKEEK